MTRAQRMAEIRDMADQLTGIVNRVNKALSALINSERRTDECLAISLQGVVEAVSLEFDVPEDLIIGRTRISRIAEARQVVFYLARKVTKLSLAEIGLQVGSRDHGTVLYGEHTVRDRMDVEPVFAARVQRLERELRTKTNDQAQRRLGKTP